MLASLRQVALLSALLLGAAGRAQEDSPTRNTSYTNPILPGMHADPTCVFVPELDDTTFCTTSSFLNFPGLPIYATKDLIHYKHVSNAFNRHEQIPGHASMNNNNRGGVWAPTLRYRDGKFYVIVTYVTYDPKERVDNLLFVSDDPFDDAAWSEPFTISNPTGGNHIDPDIFWDEDGTAYMATGWGTIFLSTIDPETGEASERTEIWEGTGGSNPEAPHIYRKDGYYYLLVAEGGTGPEHAATIARSKDIWGPYESYENNPVLTNRGTDRLIQTVGHADLFQDADDNWWAVALATRAGPGFENYPMGRETILTPVTWEEGEWPVFDVAQGRMQGPLPKPSKDISADGPWAHDGDMLDFRPGSSLPRNLIHFRGKDSDSYKMIRTLLGGKLQLQPSSTNLTGSPDIPASIDNGVTLLARRQTASLFNLSVDVSFRPKKAGEEAGVTVFLNQQQHLDLSIVKLEGSKRPQLQLVSTVFGRENATAPEPVVKDVPLRWALCPVRLKIEATDPDNYTFKASSACGLGSITLGTASSDFLSGGFVGSLVGIYATNNDGDGKTPSHWSRWRYIPVSQEIDHGEFLEVY